MAISWTQLTTGSYVEITKANCQYFNSTDVNDVVGFLENGKKYVAQSVTTNQISGYTWIKILVNGSVYYTAYLKDRINFATDIWINYHSEGIDVSKFQKTVDFQQVKDAGYEFALIRVVSTDSNGLYIDPYFESNVQAARAAGLKIGVYIFTYALNESQLDAEINKAVTVLSKYSFEYPIYLDYEDKSLQTMGKANVTNLCRYGFNKLMSLGYYPGLYSGHYWSTNYIDAAALSDYPFWLAHYTSQTTSILNYGVWQYGGKAVPGVTSGNCDVNYGYIDCEPYINWKGLNNKTATIPFTPTPPPTPPTPPTPINNNVNVRICPRYGTQEQWNLCKTHIPLKSEMCITQNVGIKYGDGVTTWENLTYENIASVSSKVDKVLGKDLSTNDYTNADKSSVTTSAEQRHTHSNKSILDSITTALIDGWQSAVTHITDTVKHITDAERTLWNSVLNKANISDVLTKGNTVAYVPTSAYNPATMKYVDEIASSKGNGDMLKNVYDVNNNGVVDTAENADTVDSVHVNDNSTGNVLWTATKIASEIKTSVPTGVVQWEGSATINYKITLAIPVTENYKSCGVEILVKFNNRFNKAIHGIDYVYGFVDTSHIEVEFLNAGEYKINYAFCAVGEIRLTEYSANMPAGQKAGDVWNQYI